MLVEKSTSDMLTNQTIHSWRATLKKTWFYFCLMENPKKFYLFINVFTPGE